MNSIYSTEASDLGPLVVRPKGARRMLNCGQTRLYELIAAGELDSFLDGRSRKITVESIYRYVRRRLEGDSIRERQRVKSRRSQKDGSAAAVTSARPAR
jgi:hypothetical protein